MSTHNENRKNEENRPPIPINDSTSFLSRCSFSYAFPLLKVGASRPIVESDIPALHQLETSDYNRRLIEKIWKEECKKATAKGRKNNLGRAIFWHYVRSSWYAEILLAVNIAARIGQAIVLGLLMEEFGRFKSEVPASSNNEEHNVDNVGAKKSYLYALLLVICGLFAFPSKQQQFFQTYRKGAQLRISLVAAIYAKTLRLPSVGGNSSSVTSGHVTNLASNDVQRFEYTAVMLPFLIQGPLHAIVILIVGIQIIGPVFATGFGLLFILVPLQVFLGRRFSSLRSMVASLTDERVTLVSQAVSGARVMKMNGWELEFEQRISELRSKEVAVIQKANRYRALNEALYFFSAPVLSVFIFVIHVLKGETLTPKIVFTTFTVMGIVQNSLTKNVPGAVMGLAECYISCKRIQAFFELSEQPLLNEARDSVVHQNNTDQPNRKVLSLEGVTCYWKFDESSNNNEKQNIPLIDDIPASNKDTVMALADISLALTTKKLYCVIGKVGSGKSALLQALAGELPITHGTLISKYQSISYAAQDPWIMDGSIRENIIMGLTYNEEWYSTIIEACGLGPDIETFTNGDLTIVGDRGLQCSGGQRSRIGLARALYCDAEVCLLDDPLSAVDAKVARAIYFSAIHDLAVKRGKCVVLVTHQLQFVGSSDCILMKSGKICCTGSFVDCVKASKGDISDSIQIEERTISMKNTKDTKSNDVDSTGHNGLVDLENSESKEDDGQIEKRDVGIITMETWKAYGKALGGVWVCFFLLLMFGSAQASLLFAIVIPGKWAEAPADEQNSLFWLIMTSSITGGVVILSVLRALMSYFLLIKTSQRLHDRMLHFVLRARIQFYDTNPIGRILNRFSADIGIVDETFPYTIHDFVTGTFVVTGSIITALAVLPFILVVLPPLMCYFVRLRKIFVSTSRELKRLEGIGRSPIYAMLSESLNGIATIRSNAKDTYFMKKFEEIHDAHTRAYFAFITSSRWFAFRLDFLSFILMSTASILAILFHDQRWFNVDSAVLGLALTLLIQISTTNFPWVVRQSAEVSNQMVSVERVVSYGSLQSEAPLETEFDKCHKNWPEETSIVVQKFSTRYRSNLPLVLSDVSFKIKSGERIGVVGRTGSGKSSLMQALFRILEAESGTIEVGGIDISLLGLHKLRTSMAVIPQVPVLFSGCTIHENLDPFGKCDISEVNKALVAVQMKDTVYELPYGLNTPVDEGGSNFSVGQRQLICLARAILMKSTIIILDEPTANVDINTDQLLQKTLKEVFVNATIIMIAHRLQTILGYDRILVLGTGKVLEFGKPKELLSNENGHFTSMLQSAGDCNIDTIVPNRNNTHPEEELDTKRGERKGLLETKETQK